MDYAIIIQGIIDALKADAETNPKWRNKVTARLEEIQPWCLMLYETPDFSDAQPDTIPATLQGFGPPLDGMVANIPASLQEFAAAPQVVQVNPSHQVPMPPSTQPPRIT